MNNIQCISFGLGNEDIFSICKNGVLYYNKDFNYGDCEEIVTVCPFPESKVP